MKDEGGRPALSGAEGMKDEVTQELRVMRTPRTVDIDLTARCNLRCRYCYFFDNPAVEYHDLPTEEWLRFFDELGRCAVMDVCLAGGEPFIARSVRGGSVPYVARRACAGGEPCATRPSRSGARSGRRAAVGAAGGDGHRAGPTVGRPHRHPIGGGNERGGDGRGGGLAARACIAMAARHSSKFCALPRR